MSTPTTTVNCAKCCPKDRVKSLRALGFKIAVDDLGAGYAGLSSFSQLDPDIAKLDMSLNRDIPPTGQP